MKEITSNVYVSTEYPGVNVGFVILPEGVIAIDVPTLPRHARAWRQRILETAGKRILYLVLTDEHPDRLLSAGIFSESEAMPIVAARPVYERAVVYTDGFWRSVVEGWTRRYPEHANDLLGLQGALPEIMFTTRLMLHKGGETVTVEHIAGAAAGSAWIHLPEKGVLFVGDTVVTDLPPVLSVASDTKAWLTTLTALRRSRFSDTIFVPGRGSLGDQSSTRAVSDYLALVRRRVRSLHASGQARAEVALVVAELMSGYSIPDEERDWVQRYVKAGVDRVYEELRPR
ncbi:MAG TPA: MBL fold metallo-hydrolase [Chloroflexi bacterium]|nr:MBL fold metallo-hydrolase [Chloroflexota bacterium]